ncbi:hypothetical protein [Streptomyces colonosanans]|uniref:Uncharacterized protein n=1 Tax=Streptomyces colonosanans TaxID=1428652 RepID=A0A1S2Q5K6_9ACTN|nr:hypothetical protein [Streptomyces colonosanans]OIK01398.1 hypothetical protein BIV24_01195 [Streptomyces colonosanans]
MSTKRRIATLIASTALLVGGTVTMGAGTAAADPNFTFKYSGTTSNGSFTVAVYNNGTYAGLAEWNADPVSGHPGDAMRAGDVLSDGWYVKAILLSPYRLATTQGHPATYLTPWKTGDLPEGQKVEMRVAISNGTTTYLSQYYTGHA